MDYIIGSDEAGYGTLAGDLIVVAVAVPVGWKGPPGLKDSKKMSQAQREAATKAMEADPTVEVRVHRIEPAMIDLWGVGSVLPKMHKDVHMALLSWATAQDHSCDNIADGSLNLGTAIRSIPRADQTVPACSAASVFAKVLQVNSMMAWDKAHPGYGFAQHHGYPTKAHLEALRRLGPCVLHRKSYEPVANVLRAMPQT